MFRAALAVALAAVILLRAARWQGHVPFHVRSFFECPTQDLLDLHFVLCQPAHRTSTVAAEVALRSDAAKYRSLEIALPYFVRQWHEHVPT